MDKLEPFNKNYRETEFKNNTITQLYEINYFDIPLLSNDNLKIYMLKLYSDEAISSLNIIINNKHNSKNPKYYQRIKKLSIEQIENVFKTVIIFMKNNKICNSKIRKYVIHCKILFSELYYKYDLEEILGYKCHRVKRFYIE